MREDVEAAQRYRQRAEELRIIADTMMDRQAGAMVHRVAEEYELLADVRLRIHEEELKRGG